MTEFIIVVAAVAALTSAPPSVPEGAASAPDRTAVRAFTTYPDAAACEATAVRLPQRPGLRFVCLPVERSAGLPDAY